VIDPNNIYLVFYPQGTTITTPEGTSCVTFSGYHSEGSQAPTAGADGGSDTAADAGVAGGPSFVYAVIPRCPIVSTLTGIDAVTAVISHELVEAATDPLLLTNPAYGFVDRDHVPWALGRGPSQGGELGDICHSESAARIHQRLVGDFMVDRMWSNQAAELNQDPCVPAGPDPYIGAAPDFAETVRLYTSATTFYFTTGQKIAVGQTATVDVRLFSTQATADWYVEAVEVLSSPGAPRTLQFAWDKSSGHNGDVLKLMITRTANGALQGTEIVIFSSTTTSFSQTASWDAWSGWVAN
jgi:hypothetical protein